ncbi:MAG TPA: hypothetical protein VMF64_14355 [Steroidobacteraceae bacterium]|nr:hypothetical protein [Steroidobacteraceae bacterium]
MIVTRAYLCAAVFALAALPLLASARADAADSANADTAHVAHAAHGGNATVAGDFWAEPPTLQSLGFEWRIAGDDNRNAVVEVSYRRQGEAQWRRALPLLRLQGEQVTGTIARLGGGHHYNDYTAPNMFAGSILNLTPGTVYECRFLLSDPDGVHGRRVRTVTIRTRSQPRPAPGGAVYHVYPFGYTGVRQQPAFTGLLAAYYLGSQESDHSREMPPRVQRRRHGCARA